MRRHTADALSVKKKRQKFEKISIYVVLYFWINLNIRRKSIQKWIIWEIFCTFNIAENWILKVCDRLKTPKMASGHYWKVQKKFDKNSAKNVCMLWDFFRMCVWVYMICQKNRASYYYYTTRYLLSNKRLRGPKRFQA